MPGAMDHIPPWPHDLEILPHKNFVVMDLSYNKIREIHHFPEIPVFNLDISHNELRLVKKEAFVAVSIYLHMLDLSDNKLDADSLEKECFKGGMDEQGNFDLFIIHLSLAKNRLHTVHKDLFKYLTYLDELDLSHNPLAPLDQDFVDAINSIKSLQSLTFREVGLEYLPQDFLIGLEQFKEIDLAGNCFTQVDPQLRKLINLQSLNLDTNLMQSLDEESFSGLTNLQNLSVSDCPRLRFVDQLTFEDQNDLRFLRMRKNPELTWISPDAWLTHSRMESHLIELDISDNGLPYLPSTLLHSFSDWKTIQVINLQGNPWMCDCHNEFLIYDLVPMIYNNTPALTQNILCNGPRESHLIKEELMIVQEITQQSELKCTHEKFSFYVRTYNLEDEFPNDMRMERRTKDALPLAIVLTCFIAITGTTALVVYLYLQKKKLSVNIRRPRRDNPAPRVAYFPANFPSGAGYVRQKDEPTSTTEEISMSYRDNEHNNESQNAPNQNLAGNEVLAPKSATTIGNDMERSSSSTGIQNPNCTIEDELKS
eukprot:TRINITY_DN26133_c0_g1_i9.p1 TRINITY_DN26133_c0_g1~~TRINITY_DN26133_c0_g1_i9.p1  ORF type:complete len:539 (-),score=59.19 TRINITY_DN26133_c0_g1_i9:83-1699(-)